MDENLKYYFKSLGFASADINNLIKIEPALKIIDYSLVKNNIALLCTMGYPEVDLDSIIAINPSFLVKDYDTLKSELLSLGGNIEEKLKDDPFLI